MSSGTEESPGSSTVIEEVRVTEVKKLTIVMASPEAVPFAKTGGLADVAGALPKALRARGHDVRLVMPYYGCIMRAGVPSSDTRMSILVSISSRRENAPWKEPRSSGDTASSKE